MQLGLISIAVYHKLKKQADIDFTEYLKREAEKKVKQKEKVNSGGPNYFLLQLNRNSRLFTQVVLDALRSGYVQPTQASFLLGTPANNFHKLEAQIYR